MKGVKTDPQLVQAVVDLKGVQSASTIAEQLGLPRNTVLLLWRQDRQNKDKQSNDLLTALAAGNMIKGVFGWDLLNRW